MEAKSVVLELTTRYSIVVGSYLRNYFFSAGILGLRPANARRRYKVTPSLIGWAQT